MELDPKLAPIGTNALLHGHCHQKAFNVMGPVQKVLASVGQRLLDASSRAIVKQSLEGLHAQIRALSARLEAAKTRGASHAEQV